MDTLSDPLAAGASDPVAAGAALFTAVWSDLERDIGLDKLCFPKLVVWLNGAPGAGKGTNTPLLMEELKITAPPVVTSDLLTSPECLAIKARGELIDDRVVAGLLFKTLLQPQYKEGVLIDGFPRTRVQAECVRLFRDRLQQKSHKYSRTPRADEFPPSMFRFVVLQVSEQQAVERQLKRGREVLAHNERVKATGQGQLQELRPTDVDPAAAAKRYRVFCESTVAAMEEMSHLMSYHCIDATGDIETVRAKIIAEFHGKR
jgi:adenylate kinase